MLKNKVRQLFFPGSIISYYHLIEVVENARVTHRDVEFQYQPLISIIIPVYNTPSRFLAQAVSSVENQIYTNWEVCLCDDCSTRQETMEYLKQIGSHDKMRIVRNDENSHISVTSNNAITLASGEFVAFLDHDDMLHPHALFEVVKALNLQPELDFIYTDEDFIEEDGSRGHPHFKSDFNPDLLTSHNYITHFAVIRKRVGDRIGWFRPGYEGAQDWDLFLRLAAVTQHIHHLPQVLYHWRRHGESTALSYSNKNYAHEASLRTLTAYLHENNIAGRIEDGPGPGAYHVRRQVLTEACVSIIIPFKDKLSFLKRCVKGIYDKSGYDNFEIILVNHRSREKSTLEYLDSIKGETRVKVLNYEGDFNYAAINNFAVRKCGGEFLLFLNNDVEAITKGWLSAMVEHIQRPEVGAVGAKLLYSNHCIQHAGVVLGIGGCAGHSHKTFHDDENGYFYRPRLLQDFSACTAACLMVKRRLFEEIGGFDEHNLKVSLNDIDLCLKIREKGKLIVYTPHAKLFHYESISRGKKTTVFLEGERDFFIRKWASVIANDPYYNPNLSNTREDFSLNAGCNYTV